MKSNFFTKLCLAAMLFAPMSASAQVTIGSKTLPQTTLDIIGDTATVHGQAFRLIDGNQSSGKVLTAGEDGVGTWQDVALRRIVGNRGTNQVNIPFAPTPAPNNTFFIPTGTTITLPPGKWEVSVTQLIRLIDVSTNPPRQHESAITADTYAWVRSSFIDDPTATVVSSDIVGGVHISGMIRGPIHPAPDPAQTFGLMNGRIIIHNQSEADKTYYYAIRWINANANFTIDEVVLRFIEHDGENVISATRIF